MVLPSTNIYGIEGEGSRRVWTAAALLMVMLLAAALRFYKLGELTFWRDESLGWFIAHFPLERIWSRELGLSGAHPPLYYTLQKAWLIFGSSEVAMRSLSVVAGCLSVPAAFVLGRLAGGTAVGLTAGVLLAISPSQIWAAHEAKAYTFLTLLTLLATISLVVLFSRYDGGRERAGSPRKARAVPWFPWAAYVATAAALLHAHSTGVAFFLLLNVAATFAWLLNKGRSWRFARHWMLANAGVVVLFGYWLSILIGIVGDKESAGYAWLENAVAMNYQGILTTVRNSYGLPHVYAFSMLVDVLLIGLFLFGILAVRKRLPQATIFATILIGAPFLLVLLSFHTPILLPRIQQWMIGGILAVAVAAGVNAVPHVALRSGILAGVTGLHAIALDNYYETLGHGPAWDRAAVYVRANIKAGSIIYYYPPFALWSTRYYMNKGSVAWDEAVIRTENVRYFEPYGMARGVASADLAQDMQAYDEIWLIEFDRSQDNLGRDLQPAMGSLSASAEELARAQFGEISVYRYRQKPGS